MMNEFWSYISDLSTVFPKFAKTDSRMSPKKTFVNLKRHITFISYEKEASKPELSKEKIRETRAKASKEFPTRLPVVPEAEDIDSAIFSWAAEDEDTLIVVLTFGEEST